MNLLRGKTIFLLFLPLVRAGRKKLRHLLKAVNQQSLGAALGAAN